MKFAISGDWHLHAYVGPHVRILEDGCNSRLRDILDAAEWMKNTAIERRCDAFLHGGDLMHNRKSLPNEAWERIAQFMRKMNNEIPTHVLVGNHDLSSSGDGTSTVKALDGLITAVTKVKVTDFNGYKIGWLPYMEDPIEVREAVDKLLNKGARTILGHLGIGDPKFSACVPTDYETPGRINVSDLSPFEFDQVLLSHYHASQNFSENARYCGSPLQLSFKEAGQVKGFWIFDTETQKAEWIENTQSPEFRIVDATTEDPVDTIRAGQFKDTDFMWVKNASRAAAEELRKMSESARIPIRIDVAPVQSPVQARITEDAVSEDKILEEYTRIKAPDLSDAERTALVKVGLELKESVG